MSLAFNISHVDGFARRGVLKTKHGDIQTPAFMPVGTAGTVKGMFLDDVAETGADVILGNTYHLMLRPTAERVARLGGLHQFIGWDKPILTDSGGYQVMSLGALRKLDEDGVTFKSHIDGSKHRLTPERSMEIQHLLGSTITMIFDECTPFPATEEQTKQSMELSLRWAERSMSAYEQRDGYGLFGIVQGGMFEGLRERSATQLAKMGFDGMAIGGLAVGEGQQEMLRMLDITCPMLPDALPHYLMGVGKPDDLVEAVFRGVDMFDCVLPTRSGRNGQAFTWDGPLNLRNAKFAEDESPLDSQSPCAASANYSKAYLHHLIRSGEMLGGMLVSWHNIAFYQALMHRMRIAIEGGTLAHFRTEFLERYKKPKAQLKP